MNLCLWTKNPVNLETELYFVRLENTSNCNLKNAFYTILTFSFYSIFKMVSFSPGKHCKMNSVRKTNTYIALTMCKTLFPSALFILPHLIQHTSEEANIVIANLQRKGLKKKEAKKLAYGPVVSKLQSDSWFRCSLPWWPTHCIPTEGQKHILCTKYDGGVPPLLSDLESNWLATIYHHLNYF